MILLACDILTLWHVTFLHYEKGVKDLQWQPGAPEVLGVLP